MSPDRASDPLLASSLPNAVAASGGETAGAALPAGCWAGYFCAGQNNDPVPNNYGCGWHDVNLRGEGWWVNDLKQGTKRVKMYDFNWNPIYTTPVAPYSDWTADWDDVYHLYAC
ncbi:hypothetical protein HUT19_00770 [Streptomyces sp. NA02950]|uniref:hypothetical protein n=1 Tax=Streptomyces sp. NA02950 TaxID=2742137 RepID=UPI00158FEC86|nr:hypothetical protein [Streptomyces sp. NA02950]QKV90493.1 hypothetical protein HUT19_00770 [Streptomyces sp. NA02950]